MARLTVEQVDRLVSASLAARKRAYAPYSRFKVGAALLTDGDEVIQGCNVENATFGLCICAERNAIASAVARGHRSFSAMAIATSGSPPSPPCGMCLQFMAEFCIDLNLVLVNTKNERRQVRLSRLMSQPFRWKGAGT